MFPNIAVQFVVNAFFFGFCHGKILLCCCSRHIAKQKKNEIKTPLDARQFFLKNGQKKRVNPLRVEAVFLKKEGKKEKNCLASRGVDSMKLM
jgi:hypothetical protein